MKTIYEMKVGIDDFQKKYILLRASSTGIAPRSPKTSIDGTLFPLILELTC